MKNDLYFNGRTQITLIGTINMKRSIFKKEVSATGSYGTVKAEVVATMNYSTRSIKGTNASSHDDYIKTIPIHKVEIFINGIVWRVKLS